MGRDTSRGRRGPHQGTQYVYYRCRGRKDPGLRHAQTTRNAALLDTAVWQMLTQLFSTPRPLQLALTVDQTTESQALDAERTCLQAALTECEAAQAYLVDLASVQQAEIGAVTQKLQALRDQQTQIWVDLARLEMAGQGLAAAPRPTAADLTAVCSRVAPILASRDLTERRTLLRDLALTVVWHPEDLSVELWGMLPLPTHMPFSWNGTTVRFQPSRRFVPGTPLSPPSASGHPAPLALPFPP